MGDQAALQEAIQRARQLAAKISQNAPVKRTASEMDDHSIGTVKVTLAYEKPANSDNINKDNRSSNLSRDNNNYNKDLNHPRDRDRDKDRDHEDRDNAYLGNNGNNAAFNPRGVGSNNPMGGANPPPSISGTLLGGQNNYSSGQSSDDRIEIIIPHAVIGLVIGKGGENIKRIQNETGATVRVDPNTVDEKGNKVCTITGTKQAVEDAHSQVSNVIENAATNKRPRTVVDGSEQYRMKIPGSRTGAIIGKGGETIKSIKQQSGCDIELDKNAKECGPDESVFIIRGTQDKIQKARSLIEARLASRGGGSRDGRDDRGGRDDHHPGRSNQHHSVPKGMATGANAAPVAQFTDLPSAAGYPAAGQQSSADVSAAWAAYYAQYSNMMTQAGPQLGSAGLPYAGQSLLGAAGAQQVPQPDQQQQQQHQQQAPPQAQSLPGAQQPQDGQPQQDYTDQWIEFYLMHGRPDYAEHIIEMKKQQQQQQQAQKQV